MNTQRQMRSELDTKIGVARSKVIELERRNSLFESKFESARADFLEASQQLWHHGNNYARKSAELIELEGKLPDNVRAPYPVELVTIEEVEAFVP